MCQSAAQDNLLPLVAEVVADGHSVLVFCGGRSPAKSCAGAVSALRVPHSVATWNGCRAKASSDAHQLALKLLQHDTSEATPPHDFLNVWMRHICRVSAELVKNLLPGALEALHDRRRSAGEPGCSTLGPEAAAKLAQDREELAAALDAATGAYVNVDLRGLLLAGRKKSK